MELVATCPFFWPPAGHLYIAIAGLEEKAWL